MMRFADAEPNGLARMLGELISANLERHPARRRLLRPAVIAVTARDAGVCALLSVSREGIVLHNGIVAGPGPDLHVSAPAEALLLLASVPLRARFPDPLTRGGRRALLLLLRRDIRIQGLFAHPAKLARLSKLLSVA